MHGGSGGTADEQRLTRNLVIQNQLGMHARPCGKFVRISQRFQSEIRVEKDGDEVNGKSIMGLMMLAAGQGTRSCASPPRGRTRGPRSTSWKTSSRTVSTRTEVPSPARHLLAVDASFPAGQWPDGREPFTISQQNHSMSGGHAAAAGNRERPAGETRFQGFGVSPGLARGRVFVLRRDDESVPDYADHALRMSPARSPVSRRPWWRRACRSWRCRSASRRPSARRTPPSFDAHLLVVEDRSIIDEVLRGLARQQRNVEAVFKEVTDRYAQTLAAIDDPYLRERALDVHDVTRRILMNLAGPGQPG